MSNVCVVGLGKIGLPLACAVARGGHHVRGLDISNQVVDQVNRAEPPFPGEAGLDDALTETVGAGRLVATTDAREAVHGCEVVIVVVPLVVDEDAQPDFRAMDAATEAIGPELGAGALVSYETTLPVGTTRHRFAPTLERLSGLTLGEDLFVVHSPERVFSGRIFEDLRRYPKLVGGTDRASSTRGVEFYESFLEFDDRPDLDRPNGVWDLVDAEAAELAKLAETTFRDVNIAFANELARGAEAVGVDVHQVIAACNSQPFSHIHQPGVAVGGHCIPVYPHFLLRSIDGFELPAAARRVNRGMVDHAVERLRAAAGSLEGLEVLVAGLSYRPGVKEAAFSGTGPLVEALARCGARPFVWDPWYTAAEVGAHGFRAGEPADGAAAVVVHTAHPEVLALTAADVPGVRVVYDGRHALDPDRWPGVDVVSLGVGDRPSAGT